MKQRWDKSIIVLCLLLLVSCLKTAKPLEPVDEAKFSRSLGNFQLYTNGQRVTAYEALRDMGMRRIEDAEPHVLYSYWYELTPEELASLPQDIQNKLTEAARLISEQGRFNSLGEPFPLGEVSFSTMNAGEIEMTFFRNGEEISMFEYFKNLPAAQVQGLEDALKRHILETLSQEELAMLGKDLLKALSK